MLESCTELPCTIERGYRTSQFSSVDVDVSQPKPPQSSFLFFIYITQQTVSRYKTVLFHSESSVLPVISYIFHDRTHHFESLCLCNVNRVLCVAVLVDDKAPRGCPHVIKHKARAYEINWK